MDNVRLYLCKADCSLLGTINGIKTETGSLKRNATDLWELTFEVDRFIDVNGELVQSDYYDSIDDMMRLYLDNEEIQAFFVIDSEPTISGDGLQEVKTVTAHSIETELSHIYLSSLKINCGTYDSQEYLIEYPEDNPRVVTDKDGNIVLDANGEPVTTTNNINPYTGLPYEYISLVNYERPELSLMHIVLDGTGWTVKDNIAKEVCEIKKCYDTSNSVYAFLMKTVSPSASVIFEFDRKHKQIGIVLAENYGKDTGVFVTMRNLMNSFEVTSSSEDAIMTKLIPTGANGLGILYANFGEDSIINLDYFMNTLNEYGDYKFVSKELHDKYESWKNKRDVEQPYEDSTLTRREMYSQLTRLYNQTLLNESELRNKVPNDGAVIDYKTFTLEELKIAKTAYEKALFALVTIYKNEYGVTKIGEAPNYTPTPSDATNIKNTPYWYDYYAYKEQIIPSVIEAFKMYCKTDAQGNLVTDVDGHYIELEYGNPDYYADYSISKEVDAYLYEWSLYGLDELESKKKAWGEAASILSKDYFIATGTASNPTYITVDDWDKLGEHQADFTSEDAFINQLDMFLDYMSFDEGRYNSLTKSNGMGIIRQCEKAIEEVNKKLDAINTLKSNYDAQRDGIKNEVSIYNKENFTDNELRIIETMLRQKDYSNENIITTSLDDVISDVDKHIELYQDALKELDKISQPQYSFATELDNLYSLEEFKEYRDSFDVGNFIRVGLEIHEDLYENNYVKLRLMSITHNPFEISEELSVEFSTMTKTLNTVSDLAFLLNKESSSGGNSSSNSSSGGTYGNNDANVQMSNTMLNALLSTELFGTAVNDVILDTMKANKGNFNTLFAHSGVFDSLEAGQIKVSGDCLFDRIKSSNWNGTEDNLLGNTEGSILELSEGKFNFGGGNLTWDGSKLSVIGDIVANSLRLGSGAKDDENFNFVLKDTNIGKQNSTHTSSYFNVSKDGLLKADNAYIYGTIYATDGEFSGTLKGCDGSFTGSINVNNKFIVDSNGNVTADGTLVASDANIEGDIKATTLKADSSGSIAGWEFNSSAFYKNSSEFGVVDGKYLGDNGFSISDYFRINDDGILFKSKNYQNETYDYVLGEIEAYFQTQADGSLIECTRVISDINLSLNEGDYIKLYTQGTVATEERCIKFGLKITYDTESSIGIETDGAFKQWYGSSSKYTEISSDVLRDYVVYTINYASFTNLSNHANGAVPGAIKQYNPIIRFIESRDTYYRGGGNYSKAQLVKVERYSSDGTLQETIYNNILTPAGGGMLFNLYDDEIKTDYWKITNGGFTVKNGGSLSIECDVMGSEGIYFAQTVINQSGLTMLGTEDNGIIIQPKWFTGGQMIIQNPTVHKNPYVCFDGDGLTGQQRSEMMNEDGTYTTHYYHFGIYGITNTSTYERTSSEGSTLKIQSDGTFSRYVSSSERYKDNMTTTISEELNPYKLYDINIYDFKYKDWYLSTTDQRYNKNIIGFKAEDVYEKYPIACNLDSNGLPEVPEYNILIAPMLWLIQDQHKDIENLKDEIKNLRQIISNSEVS